MKDERLAEPHLWSAAGFRWGIRLAAPAIPVMALFGIAFGAFAAQKGLTLIEAALMSALTFAGASQFVAAEIWTHPMTAAGIATIGIVTATVNARFVLMAASVRPWLGRLPAWQTYPALALLTEPGWLIALRYRAAGGAAAASLLGSGVALWLTWIVSTVAGSLLGAVMTDPERYGLDLVMPVFFIVVLVPLWRGARAAVPWAIAGAVALLVARLLPGSWYIVAGAVAGAITAGVQHERA